MRYTDYNEVIKLAKDILKDDKQMIQLSTDLKSRLMKLKSSFQDDGIIEVETYINGILSKLSNAQGAFSTIANELMEYANSLKLGKG